MPERIKAAIEDRGMTTKYLFKAFINEFHISSKILGYSIICSLHC